MEIEIEIYKNNQIVYNDEIDKFECKIELNGETKSTKRQSLADVRKEIDTFIKLNLHFKPFKAFFINKWADSSIEEKTVSAIRTDGKFVINNGEKGNHSYYYDKKEMQLARIFDAEISKGIKDLKEYAKKVQAETSKEIKALIETMKPLDLSMYYNDKKED